MFNVMADETTVFTDKYHDLKMDENTLCNQNITESKVVKLVSDFDFEFSHKIQYCWIKSFSS